MFDIFIKQESDVLIFYRDIRYFHQCQRCNDMMMMDSPAACNCDYCCTILYSILEIIALFQPNNYIPEQMRAISGTTSYPVHESSHTCNIYTINLCSGIAQLVSLPSKMAGSIPALSTTCFVYVGVPRVLGLWQTTSRSKALWRAKCDFTTSTMSSSLTIAYYKIY